MVQIIPPDITGSQLVGESLGQGVQNAGAQTLGMMLDQFQKQQKTNQIFSALGINPNGPGNIEAGRITTQSARPGAGFNITPESILGVSMIDPQLGQAISNLYKTQQKEAENAQSQETAQGAFNRMSELLSEGNLGLGSKLKGKAFGGKTAEDVGEFESLSGALEALLVDKVSRGTLSNSRFKYITETLLPKPGDRQATIKGKLKALSKELNLELPPSFGKKFLKPEEAKSFLEKAKGDKDKARKMAKAQGYEL